MKQDDARKFVQDIQRLVSKKFGPECALYDNWCVNCNAHRVARELAQLVEVAFAKASLRKKKKA